MALPGEQVRSHSFEIHDRCNWRLEEHDTKSFQVNSHLARIVGAIRSLHPYRHCKPGGFLEVQELDPALKSDDGTDELSKYHHEYIELICKASKKYGKPVPSHTDFKTWLEEAGFVDVEERFYKIPVSSWPKDKKLKEIGKYQCLNYTEGLEGISIGLFTRVLNWQPMEFSVFLARIRAELKDKNIHCYQRL